MGIARLRPKMPKILFYSSNNRKWVCKRYKIHPFIAALQWAVECCISIFFRCRKFDQVIIKRWDLRWCLSGDAKQNHLIFNPKILSNLRWNAKSNVNNDFCTVKKYCNKKWLFFFVFESWDWERKEELILAQYPSLKCWHGLL